jgi:HSP20 family protein
MSRKSQRDPAAELTYLQREIEQIFARLASFDRAEHVAAGEWTPAVDVFESKEHLAIVVEVPGLTPETLSVTCRNRQLVISGERRHECPEPNVAGFLCMERPHGRFTRSIPVTLAVDVHNAQARLRQGVLTILIPRLKERRSREIVIPIQREEEDHE